MKSNPSKLSTAIGTVLGTAFITAGAVMAFDVPIDNPGAEGCVGPVTPGESPPTCWTDAAGDPSAVNCDIGQPFDCSTKGGPDDQIDDYAFYTGDDFSDNGLSVASQPFTVGDLEYTYYCQEDVPTDYIPASGIRASALVYHRDIDSPDFGQLAITTNPGNLPVTANTRNSNSVINVWTELTTAWGPISGLTGVGDTFQIKLIGDAQTNDGEDAYTYWDDVDVEAQCTYAWAKASGRNGSNPLGEGGEGGNAPQWTFGGGFWYEAEYCTYCDSDDWSDLKGELYYQYKQKGGNLHFVAMPDSDSDLIFPAGGTYCGVVSPTADAVMRDVDIVDPTDGNSLIAEDADVCFWFGNPSGPYTSTGDRGWIEVETENTTCGESLSCGDTNGRLSVDRGKAEGQEEEMVP